MKNFCWLNNTIKRKYKTLARRDISHPCQRTHIQNMEKLLNQYLKDKVCNLKIGKK